MNAWQGIGVLAAISWIGCSQQAPIQQNVKVERGEVVLREPAQTEPFIEEVTTGTEPEVPEPELKAPEPGKPTQELAGVPPIPKVLGPVEKIGDYSLLGFDRLASFAYEVPDDPVTEPKAKAIMDANEIPDTIKKFDEQKVALKGYMLPLKVEDGKITELLILRDQSMCCYGAVPKINEWVSVRMAKNKGVKPVMDVPVTIFGTLKVGEVLENGYLVGIYEMDGERLDGPIDL
tara:strand:+ start:637 stop:1335 length:699 start_codon:yes stop_codon:yes gene_type:complete